MIYRIIASEVGSLAEAEWLFKAKSLSQAVEMAKEKLAESKIWNGWVLTSAKEIGELENA
jgi:hypothetical protein